MSNPDQFHADLDQLESLSVPALIMRHNRLLSALRTVWASRRRMQARAAYLSNRADTYEMALRCSQRRVGRLEGENGRLRSQVSGLESDYALTLAELADLRIQLNGGAR